MLSKISQNKILISALASDINFSQRSELISALAKQPNVIAITQTFDSPKLIRELKLGESSYDESWLEVEQDKDRILYQGQMIGKIQILYKVPLPGELQARLAIESAIDRFLEYLQKIHQIVVLEESDRHVNIFIPKHFQPDFYILWKNFLEKVVFSTYGDNTHQLPGLIQTFILIFNAVALAGRGASTLDVPILTQEQADVLAALYFSVVRDVEKRQIERQEQIDKLKQELSSEQQSDKERISKENKLAEKLNKQIEEDKKYTDNFQRVFCKILAEQSDIWKEIDLLETELVNPDILKNKKEKNQKRINQLRENVIFQKDSVQYKLSLLNESGGDPFKFIRSNQQKEPEKFREISLIAKNFTKTATDQINSRGNIFSKLVLELYRLLEGRPGTRLPDPLLTENPNFSKFRNPGDDTDEFCYACSRLLDNETSKWQVRRFIFERPEQRRQSAPSKSRPCICSSCALLAFASPLKVTEESIILRLDSGNCGTATELKIKDYLRMLTNKEMHLSSGRYLVLASERTGGGDLASQKLGQIQYALAKVSSIFPSEVLTDFKFSLIIQGSQITLLSRQLLLVKGLMDCYRQSIVIAGKDINMALGDAVRYVQQDLPYLADYTLTKHSSFSSDPSDLKLEQIRKLYWKALQQDLNQQGDSMDSDNQLPKRARLYRDVAALTGLTYAFVEELERTAKKSEEQKKDQKYTEREVSKIIEKVDDPVAFNYYATLGDSSKEYVRARLFSSPSNAFIYSQTQLLLKQLDIKDREEKDDKGTPFLQLYADDISRAYQHFALLKDYAQDKEWKELTYNLKLSLYTRFPELVRKQKSTSENK
jgi:hypothetical protein